MPLSTAYEETCRTPQQIEAECDYMGKKGEKPKYSYKGDIWSLGCVAYKLLSGGFSTFHVTFQELKELIEIDRPTIAQVERKVDNLITKKVFQKLHFHPETRWEMVSPIAKSLVERMLFINKKDRPSYDDILEDEWINYEFESEDLVELFNLDFVAENKLDLTEILEGYEE